MEKTIKVSDLRQLIKTLIVSMEETSLIINKQTLEIASKSRLEAIDKNVDDILAALIK
jgi:hypothetical protein